MGLVFTKSSAHVPNCYAARLREEIEAVKGEALRAFGSDKLLIEKYFESVRHVEV